MALAPLRRILSRSIEVFTSYRGQPRQFVVHEQLECGHINTSLLWDFLDLINAYTENPEVCAQRRRCRPCAAMLAKKKPASVGVQGDIRRTA